jgi:hypothetical protein
MLLLINGISMRKGASQFGKDMVEQELTMMFESKWLRAKAREIGLVERERKIDSVICFGLSRLAMALSGAKTKSGCKNGSLYSIEVVL